MLDAELLGAVRADVRERPSRFYTRERAPSVRALLDKHGLDYDRARDLPELVRDLEDKRYANPDDLWREDRVTAHATAVRNADALTRLALELKQAATQTSPWYCVDLHIAVLRARTAEQAISAWCWQSFFAGRRAA